MECEVFNISNIPAVIYGKQNDACYLVVHGQGGNKFEAERFAKIATKLNAIFIDEVHHTVKEENRLIHISLI